MYKKILLILMIGFMLFGVAQAVEITEESNHYTLSNDVIGLKIWKNKGLDHAQPDYYEPDFSLARGEEVILLEKQKANGDWKGGFGFFSFYDVIVDYENHVITRKYSNLFGEKMYLEYKLNSDNSPAKLGIRLENADGLYRFKWIVQEINLDNQIDNGHNKFYGETNVSETDFELKLGYQDLIDSVGEELVSIETITHPNGKVNSTVFTIGEFNMTPETVVFIDPYIQTDYIVNQTNTSQSVFNLTFNGAGCQDFFMDLWSERDVISGTANLTGFRGFSGNLNLSETGTNCTGSWSATYPCLNSVDDDFNTYGESITCSGDPCSVSGTIEVNFTKPTISPSAITLYHSNESYIRGTIPQSCLDADPTTLMTKASSIYRRVWQFSKYVTQTGFDVRCYNGTDWVYLYGKPSTGGSRRIHEIAVETSIYPENVTFTTLNTTEDYTGTGELTTTVTADLNTTTLNDWLDTCSPDAQGFCTANFTVCSDTAGVVEVALNTTIEQGYEYDFIDLPEAGEGEDITFWIDFNDTTNLTEPKFAFYLPTDYLYQEDADTNSFTGSWSNPSNVDDGNWGTYGSASSSAGANYYANYTIPDDGVFALWRIKGAEDTTCNAYETNLTIPNTCLTSDTFETYVYSDVDALNRQGWYCKAENDSWIELHSASGSANACRYIYEEAVWWHTQDNVTATTWYDMTNESGGNWSYQRYLPNVTIDTDYAYVFNWTDASDERVRGGIVTVNDVSIQTGGTTLCFDFLNEITEASETMDNIEAIFTLLYEDGSTATKSFQTTSTSSQCYQVEGSDEVMVNLQLQYSKTNYATREYFLYHYTMNNSDPQSYELFTINASDSSGLIITVTDNYDRPQAGTYIKVQRFYPSANAYKVVAMGLTDENGQTRIYLQPNDVYYRFFLEQDGQTVLSTDPMLVISDTLEFTIDPYQLIDIFAYKNVEVDVNFNNATKTWQIYVNDVNGEFDQLCYKIEKSTNLEREELCSSCVNVSSATFICNDSADWDGDATYYLEVYGIGSLQTIYSQTWTGYRWQGIGRTGIMGKDGAVLSGILIFSTVAVGLFNPVVAILMALGSLFVVIGMGLIELAFYPSLIAVVVAGGLLVWRLVK